MNTRTRIGALLLASALTPCTALAQGAPAAGGDSLVGEVVVTAQRREERLKDVPIAITAVSGEQLARSGVASSTDLSQVTPGLQFATSGAYAQPTIRGIGTSVTSAGSDANVAVYVDGVYMPNQNANLFDFSDVQRIEVLKGPQGTLYGRNATGGAINVTTLAPSYDPKASLSASYGSYGQTVVKAYGTSAVIPGKLAASAAFMSETNSGYSKDVLRQVDLSFFRQTAGRIKLQYDASQDLQFTVAVDASRIHDLRGYSLKVIGGNVATPNAFVPSDPRDLALSFTPNFGTKSGGASLTTRYDLGEARLSAITAWRTTNVSILTDLDRNANANSWTSFAIRQRTFTQEVNLASDRPGKLQWVTGAFYYNDRATTLNLVSSGVRSLNYSRIGSEAVAAYAQADYSLTDQLTLTGGARYSKEKRNLVAERPTGAVTNIADSRTWSSFTPRVALRYALDDASNVYGSWSKGFKSGTYNATAFSTTPVSPEKVSAFEGGYKYARGPRSLDLAAYHYSYRDIQVQAVTPSTGLTTLTNAARAKIYGAEGQYQDRISDSLRFNVGLAWTHARYTSFPNALVTIPKTTAAACGTNPNRPCGNSQLAGDASGKDMIRTPEFTANVGVTYSQALAGGEVQASANYFHNSGFFWNPNNRLKQPAYDIVNAQLSWGPDNGRWRLSLWGKNLTDETYFHYVTDTTSGDAGSYAPPRTWGVRLDLDFG
jgi:iron complex outermembrane receptor protein